MNPRWLVIAIEMDFYKNVDKLLRDNFKYVQCCLLCLIETVSDMCPALVAACSEAFDNPDSVPKSGESAGVISVIKGQKKEFNSLRGDLLTILAF